MISEKRIEKEVVKNEKKSFKSTATMPNKIDFFSHCELIGGTQIVSGPTFEGLLKEFNDFYVP